MPLRIFEYSGAYGGDGLFEVEHLFEVAHIKVDPPTVDMWRYSTLLQNTTLARGRGLLPYIGYTGMCRWKEYDFQAILSGIGFSNHIKLV